MGLPAHLSIPLSEDRIKECTTPIPHPHPHPNLSPQDGRTSQSGFSFPKRSPSLFQTCKTSTFTICKSPLIALQFSCSYLSRSLFLSLPRLPIVLGHLIGPSLSVVSLELEPEPYHTPFFSLEEEEEEEEERLVQPSRELRKRLRSRSRSEKRGR